VRASVVAVGSQAQSRKSHRLRWLFLVFGLMLVGFYAALPHLSSQPHLHRWLETKMREVTPFEIRLGGLRVGYDLGVDITALSIAVPGTEPFLTVDRVEAARYLPGFVRRDQAEIRVEAAHLHVGRLPAQRERAESEGAALSGVELAAWLFGQRVEVVDGFVHYGDADAKLGPLNLMVDALGFGDGLQLQGTTMLGAAGGEVDWSAELGASIATSRASARAEVVLDDLMRSYSQTTLPAPLRNAQASLQLELSGTESERVAFELDVSLRVPGASKTVPVRGRGEFDPASGTLTLAATAEIADYSSADAALVFGAVKVGVEVTTGGTPADARFADFVVNVTAGELLWDRFYVELDEHPVKFGGRLEPSADVVRLTRILFSMRGVGTVRGAGTYDRARARPQGKLEFDLPGVAALYRLGVRDPFVDAHPVLAGITVGGRAIGHVEQGYGARGERRLTGVIELSGGSLASEAPAMRLHGIDLRLPIDLAEADVDAPTMQRGWLHLNGLSVGDVDVGRIRLPLAVTPNRVRLSEPIQVPLLGGRLDVNQLQFEDLLGEHPSVSVGLHLSELELDQLTLAAGMPQVAGTVTGAMPNLTLQNGTVQSEGEIRIDAFGGVVRLRNLRVDELSSPVPALRLDLDFRDVSLAQLTRTFEVGRVSGIIGGEVDGLVLVDGQPVSFDARVATVPRTGLAQRISVRAIRQISILGGSGGDPFSQGVLSLFDEYRYAKMGFRCSLENDRFLLRGVEEVDGREYLVVGAVLPPRVSVVSHTRVIAFSELVRRLARIASIEDKESE